MCGSDNILSYEVTVVVVMTTTVLLVLREYYVKVYFELWGDKFLASPYTHALSSSVIFLTFSSHLISNYMHCSIMISISILFHWNK